MDTRYKIGAAMLAIVVAAPLIVHLAQSPSKDPLADKLRSYGFSPINPPSTLVDVGSLYYVSEDGLSYKAICHVKQADVDEVVQKSPSIKIQEDLNQSGSFETQMSVRLPALFKGGDSNTYVQKVHFSLTDTMVEEIPLESNFRIEGKLMNRRSCNQAVLQVLQSGGYVCQGQQILFATAEFKLDENTQNKLTVSGEVKTDEIKDALKAAITAQSDQGVVERDGQLYSGSALNFGVEVNPTCLAPPHSYFLRVLPKTRFDRFLNFVRFHVIEPWLPETPDLPPAVVQAANGETR